MDVSRDGVRNPELGSPLTLTYSLGKHIQGRLLYPEDNVFAVGPSRRLNRPRFR